MDFFPEWLSKELRPWDKRTVAAVDTGLNSVYDRKWVTLPETAPRHDELVNNF